MPYIDRAARERLESGEPPVEPGELNYMISRLVDQYLISKEGLSYSNVNEIVGVLECTKLELYRRIAAPYEDKKRDESGDVYDVLK